MVNCERQASEDRVISNTEQRLSMRAEMALWDMDGKCRCPGCGKYRKREDIPNDQRTAYSSGNMIVSVFPVCRDCLGVEA